VSAMSQVMRGNPRGVNRLWQPSRPAEVTSF
jgi:hypothetical protein